MSFNESKRNKTIEYLRTLVNDRSSDLNSDILKLAIEEIKDKKYGLVWEDRPEKAETDLKKSIPLLVEDNEKKLIGAEDDDSFNFLIEGENLETLKILSKTHRKKIDIIYIDPPYNTGNKTFMYNDKFVTEEDEFRHSKWLSFMNRRLNIAKNLLSKNGIIFISIDDNELSQLKLLMDQIFGERKFMSTISVETSGGLFGVKAKHANKKIVKSKDYILVYSNSPKDVNLQPLYTKSKSPFDTHFNIYKDNDVEIKMSDFIKSNELFCKRSKQLGVSNSLKNVGVLMDAFDDINDFVISNSSKIFRERDFTLKIPNDVIDDFNEGKRVKINNFTVYKNKENKPMYLYPFSLMIKKTDDYDRQVARSIILGDFWPGYNNDMGNIGKEGGVKLSNGKKPVRLIKNLLKLSNKKNATILDFFAGSGTTGEATLELNAEDGGHRKFILATNYEVINVAFKRMINISKKYKLNLKYFKTHLINKNEHSSSLMEYKLLRESVSYAEIQNFLDQDSDNMKIILDEDDADHKIDKNLNNGVKVYISPDVFLEKNQERCLRKANAEVHEIPNYFFGTDL